MGILPLKKEENVYWFDKSDKDTDILVFDKESKITGRLLGRCIRIVESTHEDIYVVTYSYPDSTGRQIYYTVDYTLEELHRLRTVPTPTETFLSFVKDFIFSIKTHYIFNKKRLKNVRR